MGANLLYPIAMRACSCCPLSAAKGSFYNPHWPLTLRAQSTCCRCVSSFLCSKCQCAHPAAGQDYGQNKGQGDQGHPHPLCAGNPDLPVGLFAHPPGASHLHSRQRSGAAALHKHATSSSISLSATCMECTSTKPCSYMQGHFQSCSGRMTFECSTPILLLCLVWSAAVAHASWAKVCAVQPACCGAATRAQWPRTACCTSEVAASLSASCSGLSREQWLDLRAASFAE